LPKLKSLVTDDFHNLGGVDQVDDADTDPENELNTSVVLNGTTLEVTDAGGTILTDLSSLESDPEVGANTTNFMPKWDGSSLVTGTIYDDGNVGIGTPDPDNPLHIFGSGGSNAPTLNGVHISGSDSGGNARIELTANAGTPYIDFQNDTFGTDYDMRLRLTGDDSLAIEGGNVGVGTSTPGAKLHINGFGGGNGSIKIENAGEADINYVDTSGGQNWQVGTNLNGFYIYDNDYRIIVKKDSGNVGIGTTSPSAKLDIGGQIRIRGGSPDTDKVLTSGEDGTATWETLNVDDADADSTNELNTGMLLNGNSLELTDAGGTLSTDFSSLLVEDFSNSGEAGTADRTLGNIDSFDLGFLTNNLTRLHIQNDGNVGIGTSDPGTAKLAVMGGNVGIGTTTPGAKLDIAGNIKITDGTQASGRVLTSDADGLATWETLNVNDTDADSTNELNTGMSLNGNSLELTDAGGTLSTDFSGLLGGDFSNSGEVGGADRTLGNTDNFGLGFLTNNLTRLYIQKNGNVGIGTAGGVGQTLTVQGSIGIGGINSPNFTIFQGGPQTSNLTYTLPQAQSVNGGVLSNDGSGILSWVKNFWTESGSDAYNDTGNVGIGTSNPGAKLHVFGPPNGSASIKIENEGEADINFVDTSLTGQNWQVGTNSLGFYIYDSDYRMVVKKDTGNVGIGTTNPGRKLFVNGDAGGNTSWFNDSDVRLKKDIITIENALDKVEKLRGVQFEWKDITNHPEGKQIGFIAQEAKAILPEVVSKKGENLSMQYAPITALLVEAVKELKTENDSVKDENKMLKDKLTALSERQSAIEDILLALSTYLPKEKLAKLIDVQ